MGDGNAGNGQLNAESRDDPLPDELPEADRDLGGHLQGTSLPSRPGLLRWDPGAENSVDGRLMLDPSWTPERGRSHVAALLESADGRGP